MTFSYKPHTADITIVASGSTLEELFSEIARAIAGVVVDEPVKPVKSYDISLRTESLESLLFEFADEIIGLMDIEGFLVSEASLSIKSGDYYILEGVLKGDFACNYDTSGDVKAPTYHNFFVKKNGVWSAQLTLDI